MIQNLQIKNLKCIKELSIDCNKLNLLIGTNSSGKTSVIQALLFIAQNAKTPCGLNGTLMNLGSLDENRCRFTSEREIESKVILNNDEYADYILVPNDDKLQIRRHSKHDEKAFSIEDRMFQYLSCQRVGPKNVYDKNMSLEDTIGINGEYAIAYLNQHGSDVLDMEMCKNTNDFTLLGQVNWWLKYITDTEISTEEIVGADLVKAVYRSNEVVNMRPGNVGAGISYLISVLIMCLSAPKNSINIIENPEIHLHPGAQAKVCEFLYFIACNNRQIFVETHSDHIFNGFRAGIAANEMDKSMVNIQFIYLNNEHVSEAMKVEIGKMGRIENQRTGLFDQFDLDLNRMIGL